MTRSTGEIEHAAAPPSRLAELLECERELAALLAATREDAHRLVEQALADAQRAEAELEASLEQAAEGVRREIAETSQARIHEVLRGARESAARFERLSDQDVERLAGAALRRLLGVERLP